MAMALKMQEIEAEFELSGHAQFAAAVASGQATGSQPPPETKSAVIPHKINRGTATSLPPGMPSEQSSPTNAERRAVASVNDL